MDICLETLLKHFGQRRLRYYQAPNSWFFYILLIRPQQKKVREHKTMTQNLKRGDEVITSGGIIGTVDRVFEDDRIELNISDGVKVQVIKNTKT